MTAVTEGAYQANTEVALGAIGRATEANTAVAKEALGALSSVAGPASDADREQGASSETTQTTQRDLDRQAAREALRLALATVHVAEAMEKTRFHQGTVFGE